MSVLLVGVLVAGVVLLLVVTVLLVGFSVDSSRRRSGAAPGRRTSWSRSSGGVDDGFFDFGSGSDSGSGADSGSSGCGSSGCGGGGGD